MEPKNELETAKGLILNIFSFLEKEYLYSVAVELKNSDGDESLKTTYTSPSKLRRITISYSKGNVGNRLVYTFAPSITRLPYIDVGDFFSLNTYLKSIGKDFSVNVYDEFKEVAAEAILKLIADALKTYALKIIKEEEWLDKFYPQW